MRVFCICFIFSIVASCIDPFDVTTENNIPILTVDGLISTGQGPHSVRLTLTDRFGGAFEGQINTVNQASVTLRDQLGNLVFLEEYIQDSITIFNSSPPPPFPNMWTLPLGWVTIAVNRPTGIYQTPADFQAKVGDSYTLMITLPNGDQYTSLAQSIQPVANIQDVSIHTYVRPTQNPILDASGVQFRVTLSDPAGQNNYYLWRFSDPVYEFVSNPELWNASGQIRGHPLFDHPPTCCRVCYRFDDTDITRTFNISDDGLYDGLTTTLAAHEIPDDGWRFKSRFRVRFNQYSIPEDGYRFLRLVQQQLQIEGSVFDPPPANIRGNMISLDNPDRQVLGYFFACDVSSREIYITPDDLTFRQTPGLFPDDCREAKGFSTRLNTIPPPDWKWD